MADEDRLDVLCPFCEEGILYRSQGGNYLVCDSCRHKVGEIRISAIRMMRLLEAFDDLESRSYDDDKDRAIWVSSVRSSVGAELGARGYASLEDTCIPGREQVLELAMPQGHDGRKLSHTALRALNNMRREYEFEGGAAFFDSVLRALYRIQKRTPDQARLLRQLADMKPEVRESLGLAIRLAGHERNRSDGNA